MITKSAERSEKMTNEVTFVLSPRIWVRLGEGRLGAERQQGAVGGRQGWPG